MDEYFCDGVRSHTWAWPMGPTHQYLETSNLRSLRWGKKRQKPPVLWWPGKLVCYQVKTPIGRRLLIVQTTRGDSLWVRGISEPRVKDTRVRDTVFCLMMTVVSYRVTFSSWWVAGTISHDILIREGRRFDWRLMVGIWGFICFCLWL